MVAFIIKYCLLNGLRWQEESQCQIDSGSEPYFYNNTCISAKTVCKMWDLSTINESSILKCSNGSVDLFPESLLDRRSTSVEEYWHRHVLGNTDQYNWNNFVSEKVLASI